MNRIVRKNGAIGWACDHGHLHQHESTARQCKGPTERELRDASAAAIVRQLVEALETATAALKAIYQIVDTPEAYELSTSAPIQDVLDQTAVRETFHTITAARAWQQEQGGKQ